MSKKSIKFGVLRAGLLLIRIINVTRQVHNQHLYAIDNHPVVGNKKVICYCLGFGVGLLSL